MNGWHVAKWTLLVVAMLGLALGLARTFSGSEDTWVRDEHGNWVEHGRPAGPPPPAGYQVPLVERGLPWAVMGIAMLGLVGGVVLSRRRTASRDTLSRDVRFFGTLSVVALALVLALFLALAVLAAAEASTEKISDNDVIMGLAGIASVVSFLGFLGLVALQAHGIKKLLEAHYDLKRATALLQETVERVAAQTHTDGAPPA